MPLTLKASTISAAFGAVSFFMESDRTTVRVDVSEALLSMIGGHHCSKQDRVRRLERHKRRFAQIAAFKYDEGRYEFEVNVLVVRVGLDDVIEQARS